MSGMWREYSADYIKKNRASGISVMVAAFISSLLLSFLCSLFYNLWNYEIERLKFEEGDWQSRITGEINAEDWIKIQNFANVKSIVKKEELSNEKEIVIDIYVKNIRTIFKDMVRIAEILEDKPLTISYHDSLLAMYFVRNAKDTAPRAVFPFLFFITGMACFSLIMIIHNSFAVSMNTRIRQFGILSSIGATPRQIQTCCLQEAFVLCAGPIVAGNLLGIGISKGVIEGTNQILSESSGRMHAVWNYHPWILVVTLLLTIFTIWISAWIPARKISRLTPLEAIKQTNDLQLKKKNNSHVLAFFLVRLFGIEGELAQNALRAQRKSLRTATLALSMSFLAFSLMQCFFTLTEISQEMTYFARYQKTWDIMVTVKDTEIDQLEEIEQLQHLSGVRSSVVYQKAAAKRLVTEEELSEECKAIGGLPNGSEAYRSSLDGTWMINAPIVILDDASFLEYCRQIGAMPRLDGAVIWNRIPDYSNPNFRIRADLPYVKEDQETTVLRQAGREDLSAEISVISYTQEPPVLRESYDEFGAFAMIHFLPVSVWKEIKEPIGGAEPDSSVRVLAEEAVTLTKLQELENKISKVLAPKYEIKSENRIQDKRNNDAMIDGMMLLIGGFCVLLAVIGIGNVFSNTLGFVQQRKREFARYLSVGLTLEGMKKIFAIEALVMVGRPILITLPLTAIITGFMIKASYLEPIIFIRKMPVIPIVAFLFAVFIIVAFAYYLGGKKVLKSDLIDALREDTML